MKKDRNLLFMEHWYQVPIFQEVSHIGVIWSKNNFSVLSDQKLGILGKVDMSTNKLSPSEWKTYEIHLNIISH